MAPKTFAELFKKKRTEKAISFRKLAGSIGVNFTNLTQYAKGTYYPSFQTLEKLGKILDFDVQYAFELIQSEKKAEKKKGFFKFGKSTISDLRKILLENYSESFKDPRERSFKIDKREETEEELYKYPLHPVEKILLSEIIEEISPEFADIYKKDPFEYFSRFTEEGKRTKIEQSKLKWALNHERCYIKIRFGDKEVKSFIYNYSSLPGKYHNLRRYLLDRCTSEFGAGFRNRWDIEADLGSTPLHHFELKLIEEIYKQLLELKKLYPEDKQWGKGIFKPLHDIYKEVKPNRDPEDFFSKQNKSLENIATIFQELKFKWGFNPETFQLIIAFEKGKGKSISKSFKLSWEPV